MKAVIKFEDIYNNKISHIQVQGSGKVSTILNDDLEGHTHQRFVLELSPHKTLLILNNIDIWPRVNLKVGDIIEFAGEYIWNRHGGLIHWTHHDPKGIHETGYVKLLADELEKTNKIIGNLKLGIYRHYKGNLYILIGTAMHSETKEEMVIYQECSDRSKTWVQTLVSWSETIIVNGEKLIRFTYQSIDEKN